MSTSRPNEQFQAAVRVIQNLPKTGSVKPSHDLMLRFYGLYKQASSGPCQVSQPGFWDVVGRAKWNAWKKVETLSREEAMLQYVAELKKVIESMPRQTEDMSTFIAILSTFYEIVDQDDNDTASGATSSTPLSSSSEVESGHGSAGSISSGRLMRDSLRLANRMVSGDESHSDHSIQQHRTSLAASGSMGCDAMQTPTTLVNGEALHNGYPESDHEIEVVSDEEEFFDSSDQFVVACLRPSTPSNDILSALERLEKDVADLSYRLTAIEQTTLNSLSIARRRQQCSGYSPWSRGRTLALLVAWPLLIHLVLWFIRRRRGRHR